LSAEVRLKARHPAHSCLVQAPAGSGKTELLTQRILALLAIVDEPEEILALTFTRKAAAEMRTRVMESLCSPRPDANSDQAEPHTMETWQLARKAMQRSGERGWRLTDHPARLRIMTLDSLSYSLARQLPLLSGLGGMPRPSEHTAPAYREAAELALNEAMRDYSEVAEDVLLHQDHNAVAVIRLLADMLDKREQWLSEIATHARDMDALRRLLEANLKAIMMQKLVQCDVMIPIWLKSELPGLMIFAGANMGDEALARMPPNWPDISLDMLGMWKLIADFLLTKGKPVFRRRVARNLGFPAGREFAPPKDKFKQLLGMLADMPELAESLHILRMLPERAVIADGQWKVLESLFILLILANKHLQSLFGRQGEADFAEIALRAIQALGASHTAPGDLLMRLDYSIHHILIDEFQDTSLLQMRLLQCLTAGWQEGDGRHRSLFMVGDPMQSIYRFRKAEVGLFLGAARNEAGLPAVEALQLDRNFRSSPAIVNWVNRAFQSIFPDRQEVISGAVAYAPAIAALSHEGDVNLHLQQGRDMEMEAETVVQLVRKELATPSCNGKKQRIGILARSRKHLHIIMPALAAAGIPFRAIRIFPLDGQPEVRLLRALLRALLHPADRASWTAILRAPCCGLTSRDLYELMAGDERPLWQIMGDEEAIRRLGPDARERVAFVRKALGPCVIVSGKISVRDLAVTSWRRLAMPALIDATASLNVDAAFALIESLEEGGRIDFALLDERLEKLYAAPDASEAAARVELLTMHGAKGLQWDVVILPGLGHAGGKSDSPLLAFSDVPAEGGARLLISAKAATRDEDALYRFISCIEKDKDNNELQRLLYVACTRCKTTLHMLGHVSEDTGEAAKGSLLHLLLAGGNDCFGARIWRIESAGQHASRVRKPLRRIGRLPEAPAASGEGLSEQETEYVWAGAEAAPVGRAVHAALQHVAEIGIENWSAEDTVKELNRISRMLMADGLSAEMLEAASARCSDGLRRALNSEQGRWLLSAGHSDAHSEWALSLVQAGQVSHYVIDRSFVDDRGVRWIVDYKTGSHLGGDIEAFLDREQTRHADQLRRYAEVVRGLEDRPIRLGLYFPMLDAWRELPP